MDALATMLEEHRAALSSKFRAAFSNLEMKLYTIHSKVEDQEQRVQSLEANANAANEHIKTLKGDLFSPG